MNKKICFSLAAAGLALLTFTGCSSKYPPSNFIGIYSEFDDYNNGTLPGSDSDYTGFWAKNFSDSDQISIEGNYKKGVPYGQWRSYYLNGIPEIVETYDDSGNFERTIFYPDGSPASLEKGKFSASGRKWSKYDLTPLKRWTPDGQEYIRPLGSANSGWQWSERELANDFRKDTVFFNDGKEIFTYVLFLNPDNTFKLWGYFYPVKNEEGGQVGKICLEGKMNAKSSEITVNSTKKYFGDFAFSLLGASMKDAKIAMQFSIEDLAAKKQVRTFDFETGVVFK